MQQHRTILPIRVYYEDTDAGGIVYHASYLKFFERGRTESLRSLGFNLVSLHSEHDALFAVRSAAIEFLQPAKLDQLLYIVSEIVEVRSASIRYNQTAHLETPEGSILCQAEIRLACLDSQYRPKRLPKFLARLIASSKELSNI